MDNTYCSYIGDKKDKIDFEPLLKNVCTGYCYTLSNGVKKYESDLFSLDANYNTYITSVSHKTQSDGADFYVLTYNYSKYKLITDPTVVSLYHTYTLYGDQRKRFDFSKIDDSDSDITINKVTLYIYITYNTYQTEKTSQGYIVGGILQYLAYSTNPTATEGTGDWTDIITKNTRFYQNGITRQLSYTIDNISMKKASGSSSCSIWIKGYVCTAENRNSINGAANAATTIYYFNNSLIGTTDTTSKGSTNSTSYVCHPKTTTNTMILHFYFGTWTDTITPISTI